MPMGYGSNGLRQMIGDRHTRPGTRRVESSRCNEGFESHDQQREGTLNTWSQLHIAIFYGEEKL